MFYKINAVKTLPDFNLQVQFQTGEKKIYDVKPLFDKHEEFKSLQLTYKLFEQVKVDGGGYGIYWNEFIDLACNELYFNGKAV